MLHFLQPIWLWATAAIIVPVIIHLWNVRQGKTLKVGSIALFKTSAKARAKSLRLSDVWLLLLRCLLLIMLAMLIAKPTWNTPADKTEKGWILIEKGEVNEAYKAFRPMIDTLLKQGCTFHYFDESFEEADIKKLLQTGDDTAKKTALPYWTLLNMLNDTVPANLPVYLFTDNRLQRFAGNRPDVSLHLTWHTYSTPDTTASWLQKAYPITGDSLRIIKAESSDSGTYYTQQNLSFTNTNSSYTIHTGKGKFLITGNDSLHQTIAADTATTRITIYTNQFSEDANYLRASIAAIKEITQYKMNVQVVNKTENIPLNSDWLFWLSEDALPASQIKNNVFVYETGKPEIIHSALLTADNQELATPETISLYQYIKKGSDSFTTVWKNGFNEPVLNRQNGKTIVYHFYSRFNPQWNDLVWSSSFPQVIFDLIFDKENSSDPFAAKDKRIIDSSQVQPQFASQRDIKNYRNEADKKDISHLIWLAAFILFVWERILSFKTKKEKYE